MGKHTCIKRSRQCNRRRPKCSRTSPASPQPLQPHTLPLLQLSPGPLPPLLGSIAVTNSAAAPQPRCPGCTSLPSPTLTSSLASRRLPWLLLYLRCQLHSHPLSHLSPSSPPSVALSSQSLPGLQPQRLLVHALDLGDDKRLSLPRKPKKRHVSSFPEWARCFGVYAHYLTSHQSTDLFA